MKLFNRADPLLKPFTPAPPPPPAPRPNVVQTRDTFEPAPPEADRPAAKVAQDGNLVSPAPAADAAKGPSPEEAVAAAQNDPNFQALEEDVQNDVLRVLRDPDIEPAGRQTLLDVTTSPEFGLLSEDDAEAFLEYTGNTIPGHGEDIREALADHLASSEYQEPRFGLGPVNVPAPEKFVDFARARELRQFAEGGEDLPAETPVGGLPSAQRDVEVRGPEEIGDYDFAAGEAEAVRYEYEVDGRTVEVIYPAEASEHAPTPEELEGLIESLPQFAADELEKVVIENPLEDQPSASVDGENTVRIYPVQGRSLERLQSTLTHEAAHIVANEAWGHDSRIPEGDDPEEALSEGWQDWAAAVEEDNRYVSNYARESAQGINDEDEVRYGEDYAETVELYLQVRGTPDEAEFARLYPNRYELLQETLGD